MTIDESGYIPIAAAARRLGRSEQQIRYLCKKGALRDVKVFGRRMIDKTSVENFALPGSFAPQQ